METKKKLESYYLLNKVLPQLISNKEAKKEDFVNILNVLIKSNKVSTLEKILSEKQNKLKGLELQNLFDNITEKEYIEQLYKTEQQIKEIDEQKNQNINFEYHIIKDNKLQIIFRRQFLTDYFNYNGFVEAIKEIGENFNGVEVSFEECTIEQKMFDKIFGENAINHNYTTQDDKEINIYFKDLDLQNVDLTKFTLENLEVLKDEELLSKNCLFKGCKLNFELLKIITKERFEKYMMFFGRGGNVCKILDFLDFKHLNFEQLKEIENLLPVDNLSVNAISISANCFEEIVNGETVFDISSKNMFDKVRNFEDFATSIRDLVNLINEIIKIEYGIDYLIGETGKLVELFGKIRYANYYDLKELIEFFIEKEEFKERFIDYLIKKNGKLVELFGKMGCYANYPNLSP